MPVGPVELFYCLLGLIITPGGVVIAVIIRRPDLPRRDRVIEGARYAPSAALVAVILFIVLVLIINVL